MREIELVGLDGGNLLGYLAALGTLRVLTLAEPDAEVRMSWVDRGWWTPVVHHSRIATQEELIGTVVPRITPAVPIQPKKTARKKPADASSDDRAKALSNANGAFSKDYLDLSIADFAKELHLSAGDAQRRDVADFLTAIGSDAVAEKRDGDEPATTKFRAIGAGNNEGFLGFMRTIHIETRVEHIEKALFLDWSYSDPPPFMRWDPNEHRPHALRADDPAKDRERNNVRGANRLAIEALPLFPTVPNGKRLATTAFNKDDVTWPIWAEPLDLKTVASLLASEEIQNPLRSTMIRRGVAQVFRAKRFKNDRYTNFSPAKALL